MSIMEYNGGAVIAMTGKNCVGIAWFSELRFRVNMYNFREERDIEPEAFNAMLCSMLYEKRFGPYFANPVVAGLQGPDQKPFISASDVVGAPVFTDDFVVAGTCTPNMYGMCESMYKADMDPDQLFETLSQCLMSACDRDALSGWGGMVYIITPEGVTTRSLKARQD